MIKHADQYQTIQREKMRNGKGTVQIQHLWKETELKSKTRLCAKLTLPPGTSIGLHQHCNEEEIFIITQGQAKIDDNGKQKIVNIGDTILTGDGASHAVESIGEQPLEMIAIIIKY